MIDRDLLQSGAPVDLATPQGQLIVLGREILRLRRQLASIRALSFHAQYRGVRHGHAFMDACLLNSMFCEAQFQAGQALEPRGVFDDGTLAFDQGGSCHQAAAILGGDLFVVPKLEAPALGDMDTDPAMHRAAKHDAAENERDRAEAWRHADAANREANLLRLQLTAARAALATVPGWRALGALGLVYGIAMSIAIAAMTWPDQLRAAIAWLGIGQ